MGVLVVGGPRPLAAAFPLTLALSHEGRGDATPPARLPGRGDCCCRRVLRLSEGVVVGWPRTPWLPRYPSP